MYINLELDKIDLKIVLAVFVISIAAILISYILYGRRPSEATEESIAYPKTESIIKILLAIPIGIFIGYCMEAIFMISDSTVLFSVTCIISVFIVCCIIEFIYHLDMKMLVKRWKSLLICVGTMLLIIGICEIDMFHYDEYIPDKADVKEMDISVPGLGGYFQYPSDRYNGEMNPAFSVKTETSQEIVYKIVEKGIGRLNELDEYEDSEFCVRYKMKNGQVIYRRYYMKQEDMLEDLNALCMDEKMRKEIIPIENMNLEEINKLEVYDEEYGEVIFDGISKEQIKPLLEVYKKELSQMSIREMNDSEIIGSFWAETDSEQEYEEWEAEYGPIEFKIYSNLSETLSLLKKYGCELEAPNIKLDDVKSIVLCKWIEETGEEERTKIDMEDTENVQDVLDNITNSYGIFVDPYEENVAAEIKMKDREVKVFYIKKEYFDK